MSREEAANVEVPPDPVVAPSPEQIEELAEQLRRNQIYNASGRDDPITLNPQTIRDTTGFEVPLATARTEEDFRHAERIADEGLAHVAAAHRKIGIDGPELPPRA